MATEAYFNYTAKAGDTWDSIAFSVYKVERMSNKLINANLKYIETLVFKGGEVIKIPVVETVTTPATLPPWRR